MSFMTSSLLFTDRPDDIKRVREAFDRAAFTAGNVREVIGEYGFTFLARGELEG